MDAIEKRAREILAQNVGSLEVGGVVSPSGDLFLAESGVVQAIIAALTPPDGFLLVPAQPTEEMIAAAWRHGDGDEAPDPVYSWRAMIAARPEVP
ncbi:hypothetical protein [Stenotrophomonas maltophilia]|uniref:hypothetical protein n=1 Tax=Stenotrophomonas maltophilia TaxID=40324 RepID=UPI0039C48AE3